MDTTLTHAVLGRLSSLGDETRLRLLSLVAGSEFTVSELVSVLQLPQSSVSRHLKVLADDGWLRSRADGTSRHYRLASSLAPDAAELWRVVQRLIAQADWLGPDQERARVVLTERRGRAQEFFSRAANGWDDLRSELFGARSEVSALFGLLDSTWVVGDLGAGTGAFAERIAPFVHQVIAVDRSPEMLRAARGRLADRGNVDFREGELEALPLDDACLDVAVLMLALHYVAEPARVLREAHRVVRPGGRLVVVDMREHAREEYRQTMGHLWTGFAEDAMREWIHSAGFARYDHRGLAPDPKAQGPLLFVGTAIKN